MPRAGHATWCRTKTGPAVLKRGQRVAPIFTPVNEPVNNVFLYSPVPIGTTFVETVQRIPTASN